jgi:multidrug efflux pump subunit AcrA (membrane-fusion protein)
MRRKIKFAWVYGCCMLLFACHQNAAKEEKEDDDKVVAQTPVTVTHISTGPLAEYVTLNATSSFRQSVFVKSSINGYVKEARINAGDEVKKGDVLFLLETKEAENIGSTINQLDTSFHFSGKVTIRANADGFISQLSHKAGDYVQDGEQLATISDLNSFRFIMNLPYELKQYAGLNSNVTLLLPDSTQLNGTLSNFLPTVDPVSQTQQVIIKVNTVKLIPENLVATVKLVKRIKPNAISLPKEAILANEVQGSFWIMKLLDSTTAVKIPIQKGIESGGSIEVLSPKLTPSDLILITGNYGLPDTAKVAVQEQP